MGILSLFGGGDGGGILVGQGLPGEKTRGKETCMVGASKGEARGREPRGAEKVVVSAEGQRLSLAPRDHQNRSSHPGASPSAPPVALLVIGRGESQ